MDTILDDAIAEKTSEKQSWINWIIYILIWGCLCWCIFANKYYENSVILANVFMAYCTWRAYRDIKKGNFLLLCFLIMATLGIIQFAPYLHFISYFPTVSMGLELVGLLFLLAHLALIFWDRK